VDDKELLNQIVAVVPLAQGKISVDRIVYKKSERKAYLTFFSDIIIGDEAFQAIKKVIRDNFPGLDFSLRVASPSLADEFTRHPETYAATLNALILRWFPAAKPWEPDFRWIADKGRVALELPDEFALNYMLEHGLQAKINQAVYDIFRLRTEVFLRVSGNEEERIALIKKEREDEEKRESETIQRYIKTDEENKKTGTQPAKAKSLKIKGTSIADKPVGINEITNDSGKVTIAGKIVSAEHREVSGGDSVLLYFSLTDYTGTIKCKCFLHYRNRRKKDDSSPPPPITDEQSKMVQDIVSQITVGMGVIVRGNCQYDDFDHETVMMVQDIMRYDLQERMDNAKDKRIELHLHTQMSNMDAVSSARALIERAAVWGHRAIAVTDHGVVQAFPDAFAAAKEKHIKLIPGVEGYLTEDESIVAFPDERPIASDIVVIDFETTGLNTAEDRIIEIGAVKIVNGILGERFSVLVNPEKRLSAKITEITGITDLMLRDAPPAVTALPQLMAFIGQSALAAHNAPFDCGILKSELKRLGTDYHLPQIDTLEMARKLYPDIKTHRLGSVCKRLGVSLKDAHRAVNDAEATALCLQIMLAEMKARGALTMADLNDVAKGYTMGNSTHIILLAVSQAGMTNLNRLVSTSHLQYFRRRPHMPRELVQKHRDGLIVGSACSAGELYNAILEGKTESHLSKIARFYDYLEIQPIENNAFLIRNGRVRDEEKLREINRTIISLGEKCGIPVVATGDVHFLDPHDRIFREILQFGHGFDDSDCQAPLYFKTTQEMLDEFAYLGAEKAYEVVITNPGKIADRVGEISLFPPHPEKKTTFAPHWDEAADTICSLAMSSAHALYGDTLPGLIQERLDKELKAIIEYDYATLYSIANKLATKSMEDGYLVGSRGSVGSSFVATMCGITEVNPLPPHYRCAACREVTFDIPRKYTCGIDLPDQSCKKCGNKMLKDGFDIPFEVFLGFKGDKVPDIDLNFSSEYQPTAHAYIEELFGKGYVYRAGTIGRLKDKTAYGFVMKYLEEKHIQATDAEKNRLAAGCVGVKRTTGQHPGGIVILPKGYDICQFTAVQYPADDSASGIITTHYDFGSMHDVLVKLDILGHDDPTMMHMLEKITGIGYRDIPLDDARVLSLFSSPDTMGISADDIDCVTGTLGIPEFGTPFVRQLLEFNHPKTMEELIRISGLSHGTDVWLGNAKDLISAGTATLNECICTREDIMTSLIHYGVGSKMAFDTMELVRKGKGLKEEMISEMRRNSVPDWFIDSCKKIQYMFPKGHAVAYVIMALRVAWYKIYYPLAYYAAYFSIRGSGFDACAMLMPVPVLRDTLKEYHAKDAQKLTGKEKDEITVLEMILEMNVRGFSFLPIDLYRSDLNKFIVEDGSLRIPFTAIAGFGDAAARGIIDARSQPFISIEDLKRRANLSITVIDAMRTQGCLKQLHDSDQVSLFHLL
jgi:DNA polymerase III subunit alpha, Gram-positive type